MCDESGRENISEESKINAINTLYEQTMEETRWRRNNEWQTFAGIHVIYGALITLLINYEIKVAYYEAISISIFLLLFTYIWHIRVYGNAIRFLFSTNLRSKLQDKYDKCYLGNGFISSCRGGNRNNFYHYHYKKGGGDWFLYGHRGICAILWLYCFIFIGGLLFYRTNFDNIYYEFSWKSFWFISAPVIFIIIAIIVDFCLMKRFDK
jgi:hypothetical protein